MLPNEEKDERILMEVKNPVEYIQDLKERSKSFENKTNFKPGDIVTWKQGLQNKTVPEYGTPGIVIANLNPAVRDEEKGVGSAYFNDILDIQVGFITVDNDFIIFAHDSRRFKVYEY